MIEEGRAGLEGSRCRTCGRTACPPATAHCGVSVDRVTLRPVGTVESWSVARVAPERFEPPYAFAYVRLSDGPRVFVRLEDWSEANPVEAGERVVVARGVVGRSPHGPLEGLVGRRGDRAPKGGVG